MRNGNGKVEAAQKARFRHPSGVKLFCDTDSGSNPTHSGALLSRFV
jgi:hypothetical protein